MRWQPMHNCRRRLHRGQPGRSGSRHRACPPVRYTADQGECDSDAECECHDCCRAPVRHDPLRIGHAFLPSLLLPRALSYARTPNITRLKVAVCRNKQLDGAVKDAARDGKGPYQSLAIWKVMREVPTTAKVRIIMKPGVVYTAVVIMLRAAERATPSRIPPTVPRCLWRRLLGMSTR